MCSGSRLHVEKHLLERCRLVLVADVQQLPEEHRFVLVDLEKVGQLEVLRESVHDITDDPAYDSLKPYIVQQDTTDIFQPFVKFMTVSSNRIT